MLSIPPAISTVPLSRRLAVASERAVFMLPGEATPVDGTTMNSMPLLARSSAVTMMFPVVALSGSTAVMLVPLQLVGDNKTPLSVTVLPPCVAPKFVPVMITDVPTGPALGDRAVMLGGGGVTVRPVEPHTEPAQAVTDAVPGATARALP